MIWWHNPFLSKCLWRLDWISEVIWLAFPASICVCRWPYMARQRHFCNRASKNHCITVWSKSKNIKFNNAIAFLVFKTCQFMAFSVARNNNAFKWKHFLGYWPLVGESTGMYVPMHFQLFMSWHNEPSNFIQMYMLDPVNHFACRYHCTNNAKPSARPLVTAKFTLMV